MISNKLIEEVLLISSNNKIIDKSLIERIILEQIEQADAFTRCCFNGIEFRRILNAYCTTSYGSIQIDYERFQEYFGINYTGKRDYLKFNFIIIFTILHEIEHLKESFKIQNNTGIEALLLTISQFKFIHDIKCRGIAVDAETINDVAKLSYDAYNKAYDVHPGEKIADIDAALLLLRSVENYPNFKEDYPTNYARLLKQPLEYLGKGYVKYANSFNVPLVDYVSIIGCEEVLVMLDIYSSDILTFLNQARAEYDAETRMRYGLPIVEEDIKGVYRKIRSMR